MADAEIAASLLGQIQHDLRTRHRVAKADHGVLMGLQRCAKLAVSAFIARHANVAAS